MSKPYLYIYAVAGPKQRVTFICIPKRILNCLLHFIRCVVCVCVCLALESRSSWLELIKRSSMSRNHGKNPAIRMEAKQMMLRGGSSRGGLPPSRARVRARAREEVAAEQEGEESPPSSCVSWEEGEQSMKNDSPPEAATTTTTSSMVLAGCPRCLMYVMLSDKEARCPRCNSALLLDFAASKSTRNI